MKASRFGLLLLPMTMGINSAALAEIVLVNDIAIDGFQTVPPTGSLATGLAEVTIDTQTRDFTIAGSFERLEGDVLFGHLHGPADFGQPSNIVILSLEIQGDFMRSGTFTATQRISPFQLNAVLDSRSYINIHSTAYPSGEIRGQVVVPSPGGIGLFAASGLLAMRRRR